MAARCRGETARAAAVIAALTPSDSDAATIWAASVGAGGTQHGRVGRVADHDRDVEVGRRRDAGRRRIGLDRHDLPARVDEDGGQPDPHRAEAAHDRVVPGPAGAEPGELLPEHDARRLQQGAGGDHRGDEPGDLQPPVDGFGLALVAECGELQREVQIVEERRRRAEVVRLLDEPADPEHEQQRPEQREQPPSLARRAEPAHAEPARITGTWITVRPRSCAARTISAVPPRPRAGSPSHSASSTSHRSTMPSPARS